MSTNPIFCIAGHEFSMICRNPIVIVFTVILAVLAIINATGGQLNLSMSNSFDDMRLAAFLIGMGGTFDILSIMFAFLAMCLGVISISSERYNGALRVLIAKPVYRKDIFIGKYVGILAFLFLLTLVAMTLFISLMFITFGVPESVSDLLVRAFSIVVLMTLNSAVTLAIVMLFSILLHNVMESMVVSASYIFLVWIVSINPIYTLVNDLPILNLVSNAKVIIPQVAYYMAMGDYEHCLFNVSMQYSSWLSNSLPWCILIVTEIIAIFLMNCAIISREET